MQLLKTILIIIIVFYLFRLLARYIFPLWAKYFIRKTQQKMEKEYQEKNKKEGEISIDFAPGKNSITDDIGEYIDFKEIKDKNKQKDENE